MLLVQLLLLELEFDFVLSLPLPLPLVLVLGLVLVLHVASCKRQAARPVRFSGLWLVVGGWRMADSGRRSTNSDWSFAWLGWAWVNAQFADLAGHFTAQVSAASCRVCESVAIYSSNQTITSQPEEIEYVLVCGLSFDIE